MDKERVVSISTKSIFSAIFLVVFLIGLYYIRDLVYVILTSIVLASFIEFGVQKLKRYGVGRSISVIGIYFLVIGLCGAFLYFFIPVFLDQVIQFSGFINKYLPNAAQIKFSGVQLTDLVSSLERLGTDPNVGVVQTAVLLFGGLFNFVLLIVISFYLSINKNGIENFLRVIIPEKQEEYVVGLWKRTEHKIGLWFQGQLLLGVLVGVLIYLGLLIFDIKYSLLLAIAAAIMELIPFGIILAGVPAVASGFSSHGVTGAIQVAALYTIVQQFEANLIQPLIVKKVVGISSLVVIISLLVGLKLAGFWGILLAIPAAVALMEFVDDLERKKKRVSPN